MLDKSQYATSSKYEARIALTTSFSTRPGSKFRWIFEQFPRDENLNVLELGSGTGLFWLTNRERIPESWTITLTDYSPGMIEATRKSLSRLPRTFQFEVVDAEHIPFADDHFDIVLANNMLYHVDNREAAIGHIARVLKGSGKFFASTMGKRDMQELDRLFYTFLSHRARPIQFREKSFSLENAADQLAASFPSVTLLRHENSLRIDQVEPIINYYLSLNEMHEKVVVLAEDDVPAFRNFLQDILNTEKAIDVTRDSGLFVCSKQ